MRLLPTLLVLAACGQDVAVIEREVDDDGDGYTANVDCDDAHATVNPDAPELCDGVDNDCDEAVDEDATDAATWFADADGDGHGDPASATTACEAPDGAVAGGDDCDDGDPDAFPGNEERCDGVDNDCDSAVDDGATDADTWYTDADGDGFGDPDTAVTSCDGGPDEVIDGSDCDDADPDVNPAATEVCDAANTDEDCDGFADDADSSASGKGTYYADSDGDAYGGTTPGSYCDAPSGYTTTSTDCDDAVAAVNPGATEVCDAANTDEDCDGFSDDADSSATGKSTWYADADADAYGSASSSTSACDLPSGYVANDDDCDDAVAAVNPGATEVCDAANTDEDCDGSADDADSSASGKGTYYADSDGDAYGGTTPGSYCDAPSGYTTTSTDCDDAVAAVNPGATEVCDAANTDEDCDGSADDADSSAAGKSTYYADSDGDTYGGTTTATACDLPSGYVANDDDCNDASAAISPADAEVCDAANTDEDCDGSADDADSSASGKSTYYRDADGDTYGSASSSKSACDLPSGYVANDDDCDDSEGDAHPGGVEVCDDGVDQDCSGDDEICEVGDYAGLYDVDSGYGTKIYGGAAGDHVGAALAGGDFDGDGVGDVVIGAHGTKLGTYDGAVFGYYGPFASGASAATAYDDFAYSNSSSAVAGSFGGMVSNVGDLSSDGKDDLLVWAGGYSGILFYGGDSGTSVYTLVDDGSFTCSMGAPGGDLDGAGADEWLCAYHAYSTNRGAVYVYSGTSTTASATLTGEAASDRLGYFVSGSGDVDGDGLDDVIAGAPFHDQAGAESGSVYVVPGPISGTTDVASAADYELTGDGASAYLGAMVRMAGDADGDGLDDFLVSATGDSASGSYAGAVYLVTSPGNGKVSSFAEAIVRGEDAGDAITETGLDAGDFDGDGRRDLLVGAFQNDEGGGDSGAAWLVYGPLTGTMTLATADAKWYADAGDNLGGWLAAVPDADGDGDDEIALGAWYHDYDGATTAAADRGAVWIWPGD